MLLPEEGPDGQLVKPRAKRYVSHVIAEVRRFKSLPFFCQSAVLLDISTGGFKLEFTGETIAAPGNQYWLCIPLSPLGIASPHKLFCRCECRWFDPHRFRMGGSFLGLSEEDKSIIEQIVVSLKTRAQI